MITEIVSPEAFKQIEELKKALEQVNEPMLRLKCLELANSGAIMQGVQHPYSKIIEAAKAYYNYITNG